MALPLPPSTIGYCPHLFALFSVRRREKIKNNRRRYTSDAVIQLSKAMGSPGGNLLDAVYDATTLECWVAYANGQDECAYRRPYVHIRMGDYVPFNPKPENVKVEASYP